MKIRVLNRSRQNDRLRVMLVLVHIAIPSPHAPLPVFWRIGKRTIPYSWRAFRDAVRREKSGKADCAGCVREKKEELSQEKSSGIRELYSVGHVPRKKWDLGKGLSTGVLMHVGVCLGRFD
ncbi:hypothetical protein TNCV_2553001 [Trichonephila clavipes]|nr:hypothetical protein TNCV_2553001 [Trichonephila clavipes]